MSEESNIVVKCCMKVAMPFALVVICFSFAFVGTASALAGAKNGPLVVIKNVICCGESGVPLRQMQVNPNTSGSILGPFTVSNSFSANVAVPVWTVSATLGFDVSQSYKFVANCSVNNTTNQVQNLNYYTYYTMYDFELWQSGHQVGVGSAEQYNADGCVYSGATFKGPPIMP